MTTREDATPDDGRGPGSPVLEALLENGRNRRFLGRRLEAAGGRIDTDRLGDVIRHGPVLEALLETPLDRGEIENHLGISRATSHRFTHWLREQGFAEKVESRYVLTGRGEVVAEEVLRFEANVRTADRLAPLLDAVCEDHKDFVVEPFLDATVTVADPANPYRPVERFTALAQETERFRGFNTTHMVPLALEGFHDRMFDDKETEVIYLPGTGNRLFERYPDRAKSAVEAGHLRLRTRGDLPYGLAIFDERVGIGGYDDSTGQMEVFVDTDAPIAREWAQRVYASVKADSEPLDTDV